MLGSHKKIWWVDKLLLVLTEDMKECLNLHCLENLDYFSLPNKQEFLKLLCSLRFCPGEREEVLLWTFLISRDHDILWSILLNFTLSSTIWLMIAKWSGQAPGSVCLDALWIHVSEWRPSADWISVLSSLQNSVQDAKKEKKKSVYFPTYLPIIYLSMYLPQNN